MEKEALTILVADHSPVVRASLAVTLARLGHKVILAETGMAAIKHFLKQRPDCALVDVGLQDANGYDIARAMREATPGVWIPIIFLSSHGGDEDLTRGVQAGGDDYLVKPVSIAVLGAKLRSIQRIAALHQRLAVLSNDLLAAQHQLKSLDIQDKTTGIANRQAFEKRLAQEIARARRGDEPISLMFVEIDSFKRYAEHGGQAAAEELLQRIARTLTSTCRRASDFPARYDGEKFAFLLPSTPASGAVIFAGVVHKAIDDLKLKHPNSAIGPMLTVSSGFTTCQPDRYTNNEMMILRAEDALYTAQEQGGDRYFSYDVQAPGATTAADQALDATGEFESRLQTQLLVKPGNPLGSAHS